jgi:transcription-repair coupling factor (superfamily II helicase)
LKKTELIERFHKAEGARKILEHLEFLNAKVALKGLVGSSRSLVVASLFDSLKTFHLVVLPDKESAAYFYNDLESLMGEKGAAYEKKRVLFLPTTYKRHYDKDNQDSTNLLSRAEVLNRIGTTSRKTIVVTYSEALSEKVVTRKVLSKNILKMRRDQEVSLDQIADTLYGFGFERTDFVYDPGQFSIRGGIVDIFSFSNDHPFRIEMVGKKISSIRTFNPADQLSISPMAHITILPNVQDKKAYDVRASIFEFIPAETVLWFDNVAFAADRIEEEYQRALKDFAGADPEEEVISPAGIMIRGDDLKEQTGPFRVIEFGRQFYYENSEVVLYHQRPQPSFNKNFDLLISNLTENTGNRIENLIISENPKQIERIYTIFEDIGHRTKGGLKFDFTTLNLSLHEGFVDEDLQLACYTDHQIFERYHRFHLKERFSTREAITLKELYNLNPGDFVTHIDHGIGRFDGLEKINNNGRMQEAIRIIYKNSDLLYVSIHSLHRIAKYAGKEGEVPSLSKLGSNAWNKLKSKTKKRVKDIARDLIKLYAERKKSDGYSFSPDTYMQNELEASFIYEDTPDQLKATIDVKNDMEKTYPMDRLICGDVGFGKTEVAIRAAFKSVSDSKQVAVLVPTTILALQHYKTFSDRLRDFPCKVEYISRFRSTKQQKETLRNLASGKTDILIGTHRLIGKDIKFKDLGLLIIDEEQKFGVAAKERLKGIKINVDTLTLTATPIPRTLQFSLMGARDLSVINTPPPNRYPVQTELRTFNEEVIRNAILYEVSRGGQVFFVHNRVQNIHEVEQMILKFCPEVSIAVAHGQMDGTKLERVMLEFIEGNYDVLLATTIIESGLDIPNVNTMIINEAQNYGLSDLHQLRGRVGRSNRKAFCYMLAPPLSVLTNEARKRLKAIEEFSDLGSGFNIAMRDLDIRGAGNILGAEQSGFISEIGFEMYHKILDEAIQELKDSEFKGLFKEERETEFVSECQIESDLEILIPDDYITNIAERLAIYKELDNLTDVKELLVFRKRLVDRFGEVPKETEELFDAIRLRWKARKIGFEKIILRNGKMLCYFISNPESTYFQSRIFTGVIEFIRDHPQNCRMRQKKDKLSIEFQKVASVNEALQKLQPLLESVVPGEAYHEDTNG